MKAKGVLWAALALVALAGWVGYVAPIRRISNAPHLNHDGMYKESRVLQSSAKVNEECPSEQTITKRIVVVGAGAAGMTAAKRLIEAPAWLPSSACWKPEVTVLEASHRIGGRIGKDDEWTDFPIDLGASWVDDRSRLKFIAGDDQIVSKVIRYLAAIAETDDFAGYYTEADGEINRFTPRTTSKFALLRGAIDTTECSITEHAQVAV